MSCGPTCFGCGDADRGSASQICYPTCAEEEVSDLTSSKGSDDLGLRGVASVASEDDADAASVTDVNVTDARPKTTMDEDWEAEHVDESIKIDEPEETDEEEFVCCSGESKAVYMDEVDVMKKAKWCMYCVCCGLGCSELTARFRCKYTCLFCTGSCQGAEFMEELDGLCSCVWSWCCCHMMSQLPFREDSPHCTLCGGHFFGWHHHHRKREERKQTKDAHEAHASMPYDHMVHNEFNPLYILCCGFSVVEPELVIDNMCKCCCCRHGCQLVLPPEEWADCELCLCLFSCVTCHFHCRVPPQIQENPICGCCGKKLRRKHIARMVEREGKAPKQQKMLGVQDHTNEVELADIPEFE